MIKFKVIVLQFLLHNDFGIMTELIINKFMIGVGSMRSNHFETSDDANVKCVT